MDSTLSHDPIHQNKLSLRDAAVSAGDGENGGALLCPRTDSSSLSSIHDASSSSTDGGYPPLQQKRQQQQQQQEPGKGAVLSSSTSNEVVNTFRSGPSLGEENIYLLQSSVTPSSHWPSTQYLLHQQQQQQYNTLVNAAGQSPHHNYYPAADGLLMMHPPVNSNNHLADNSWTNASMAQYLLYYQQQMQLLQQQQQQTSMYWQQEQQQQQMYAVDVSNGESSPSINQRFPQQPPSALSQPQTAGIEKKKSQEQYQLGGQYEYQENTPVGSMHKSHGTQPLSTVPLASTPLQQNNSQHSSSSSRQVPDSLRKAFFAMGVPPSLRGGGGLGRAQQVTQEGGNDLPKDFDNQSAQQQSEGQNGSGEAQQLHQSHSSFSPSGLYSMPQHQALQDHFIRVHLQQQQESINQGCNLVAAKEEEAEDGEEVKDKENTAVTSGHLNHRTSGETHPNSLHHRPKVLAPLGLNKVMKGNLTSPSSSVSSPAGKNGGSRKVLGDLPRSPPKIVVVSTSSDQEEEHEPAMQQSRSESPAPTDPALGLTKNGSRRGLEQTNDRETSSSSEPVFLSALTSLDSGRGSVQLNEKTESVNSKAFSTRWSTLSCSDIFSSPSPSLDRDIPNTGAATNQQQHLSTTSSSNGRLSLTPYSRRCRSSSSIYSSSPPSVTSTVKMSLPTTCPPTPMNSSSGSSAENDDGRNSDQREEERATPTQLSPPQREINAQYSTHLSTVSRSKHPVMYSHQFGRFIAKPSTAVAWKFFHLRGPTTDCQDLVAKALRNHSVPISDPMFSDAGLRAMLKTAAGEMSPISLGEEEIHRLVFLPLKLETGDSLAMSRLDAQPSDVATSFCCPGVPSDELPTKWVDLLTSAIAFTRDIHEYDRLNPFLPFMNLSHPSSGTLGSGEGAYPQAGRSLHPRYTLATQLVSSIYCRRMGNTSFELGFSTTLGKRDVLLEKFLSEVWLHLIDTSSSSPSSLLLQQELATISQHVHAARDETVSTTSSEAQLDKELSELVKCSSMFSSTKPNLLAFGQQSQLSISWPCDPALYGRVTPGSRLPPIVVRFTPDPGLQGFAAVPPYSLGGHISIKVCLTRPAAAACLAGATEVVIGRCNTPRAPPPSETSLEKEEEEEGISTTTADNGPSTTVSQQLDESTASSTTTNSSSLSKLDQHEVSQHYEEETNTFVIVFDNLRVMTRAGFEHQLMITTEVAPPLKSFIPPLTRMLPPFLVVQQ